MILPVIMAGGTGSRLWPLSRELYPKQFLNLVSENSMIQETVSRLKLDDLLPPLILCNEEHRFIAAEQLREIDVEPSAIILEPEAKNTAPAIALAAIHSLDIEDDPILLVLAADHVIDDIEIFNETIQSAILLAEEGKLVTFGIVPSKPETGYGYIKQGKTIPDSSAFHISQFYEKPDAVLAQQYLDSGDYLWNSGMFMFRASRVIEEFNLYHVELLGCVKRALKNSKKDLDFIRINADDFRQCPRISFDYAIMEKTEQGVIVPLKTDWSDIGSWNSLWEASKKDDSNNYLRGDTITLDTQNCYINSQSKLIATIGLSDLVIVDTKDAILISDKKRSQDVKLVVERLKEQQRTEHQVHREVYRPWGKYDCIDHESRYQVKRITVNPGAKLSKQMHHHRAEHWIVVSGTAKVTNGGSEIMLTENQSTYIPIGVIHALENPGMIPLELIEVQSGSYLGEDDIVRFEDRYGRLD